VLPVNAPESRQATLQAAAQATAAAGGVGAAAAAAQAQPAAALSAFGDAPPAPAPAPSAALNGVAALPAPAALAPCDDTFDLICSSVLAPQSPAGACAAFCGPQSGSSADAMPLSCATPR
jgi:hypothetical protein